MKGNGLMDVRALIFCGLMFAGVAQAQTAESSKTQSAPASARSARDIVPLPSIKTLTAAQAAGKKLFVQKCSVCHLPALPSYTAYGPLLDNNVVADRGEESVREQIERGSAKMPGFQYSMSSVEIEQIVGYLKTLDLAKKE
jgi:mono/diheme cytochrome c family protein